MKKKTIVLSGIAFVFTAALVVKAIIFTVPKSPEFIELSQTQVSAQPTYQSGCETFPASAPLDRNGELSVLVWNIYKQQNEGWKKALIELSNKTDLVLLQEASLTPELKEFVVNKRYSAELVRAFDVFDTSAGVLSLAKEQALRVCAHTAVEPWLRLPKSALLSEYPLSNGQELMVINIHAINFTIGTEDYQQQIASLSKEVSRHSGPMIIAGDFNTWSEARLATLRKQVEELDMKEVIFSPDERMRFMTGLALDHIFYRGLDIKEARSIKSHASDHNPLQAIFSLKKQ